LYRSKPDNHKKIMTLQFYLPTRKNPAETVYTYGTCLHTKEQHQRRDKSTVRLYALISIDA
jgi:hypothetical protein